MVEAAARGGMFSGVTPLPTSAFALLAERPFAEGSALSLDCRRGTGMTGTW